MIKSFLISGLGYASIMAGLDYFDGNGFRFWRFVFNAAGFGLFMSLMNRYSYKKQNIKPESDKHNK